MGVLCVYVVIGSSLSRTSGRASTLSIQSTDSKLKNHLRRRARVVGVAAPCPVHAVPLQKEPAHPHAPPTPPATTPTAIAPHHHHVVVAPPAPVQNPHPVGGPGLAEAPQARRRPHPPHVRPAQIAPLLVLRVLRERARVRPRQRGQGRGGGPVRRDEIVAAAGIPLVVQPASAAPNAAVAMAVPEALGQRGEAVMAAAEVLLLVG